MKNFLLRGTAVSLQRKTVLVEKKIDQLGVTCFIISLFTAQHVSNVSTSIFRSLRIIVDLFHGLYCSGSMCVGEDGCTNIRNVLSSK